ncbi:hypothetical protein L2E82_47691 [Cichorium intybus]|uniref:Uncharacterized protein n=1 Tax=Cichorium intybus TaxID=13427 RepID=A0ACB8Z0D2_CICIN|nr:hypothetical protein L2E82_47691 [Cichorium intybus]
MEEASDLATEITTQNCNWNTDLEKETQIGSEWVRIGLRFGPIWISIWFAGVIVPTIDPSSDWCDSVPRLGTERSDRNSWLVLSVQKQMNFRSSTSQSKDLEAAIGEATGRPKSPAAGLVL